MTASPTHWLRRLAHIPGSRGALLVDMETGVPVASELATGVPENALAALTGSLLRRISEAALASGYGATRVAQLEADGGHVVVVGAGSLLVTVLTEESAHLGLVRVHAVEAAKELAQ
jgi:predicted regulator of Ras-like GTPase activity (Roadblock/LC7/MglB family)